MSAPAHDLALRLATQLWRAGFDGAAYAVSLTAPEHRSRTIMLTAALDAAAKDVGRQLIATPHSRPKRQRRLYRLFYATRYLLDHVTGRGDGEELAFAEDEIRRLEDGSLEQQGQGRADWAHEFTEAVADARTLLREGR